MKGFFFALMISVPMLFSGCFSMDFDSTSSDDYTSMSSVPSVPVTPVSESVPKDYSIGDSIVIDGITIKLNGGRWEKGDSIFGPDEGEKWLVLDLTITNNTSKVFNMSMCNLELIDVDKYSNDFAIFADTKGEISRTVRIGDSIRGEIAYSVSSKHRNWDLIFTPYFFEPSEVIFKIRSSQIW